MNSPEFAPSAGELRKNQFSTLPNGISKEYFISENTGVSEENVLAHIQQAIQMNILIESGMSIDEAIKIADPTHKIAEVRIAGKEEDGSTTVLKEYNHEQ